jgi:hypothetical protein
MVFKIPVKDRLSTYPGRVTLTPVAGAENTFDMKRADMPIEEGTPLNKALLDNKAYTLTSDVVVYVTTRGNDIDGDGSIDNPFLTIQKAIDALPKHLGGHTAEISIDFGVYPERVSVVGFSGGKLVIGQPGNVFTIDGIEIVECSFVETNIYQIEYSITGSKGLFDVSGGSNVFINSDMIIDGITQAATAIRVIDCSTVAAADNITVTINNCAGAINALKCSQVSVSTLAGSGNTFGMMAYRGSIISYSKDLLEKAWSNDANTGGLVLTGTNSTTLSGATIEL